MIRRIAVAISGALALSLVAPTARSVPVPGAPQGKDTPPKSHTSKPAAAPPPAPPAAPAAPINPLLVRRRAAPPSQTDIPSVAEGQTWSLIITASGTLTCSGSLAVRKNDGEGIFSGEMSLSCTDQSVQFAVRQDATLIEGGDGVTLTFGHSRGNARTPHWQPARLIKEGPERMTGTVSDGSRNSAITLGLTGAAR